MVGIDVAGTSISTRLNKGSNMANSDHVQMLQRSDGDWNAWKHDMVRGGVDLSGADLTGRHLGGRDFKDSNLNGVNLTGADLTGCVFVNASLVGANLTDAVLAQCIIENANFTRANCTRTRFDYVQVRGAIFQDATLVDIDWRGAGFGPGEAVGAKITQSPPSTNWIPSEVRPSWDPEEQWFDVVSVDLAAKTIAFHEGQVQITDSTKYEPCEGAPLRGLGDVLVGRRYCITYIREGDRPVARNVYGPQPC